MSSTNHIAAIHTLKSKLALSEDDYRALLLTLTGKRSSKDCNQAERRAVREHLARLAEKMGLQQPTRRRPLSDAAFNQAKAQASPKERKLTFRIPLFNRPTAIVTGWQLACGMVVHRSVFAGGQRDDHWTVTDPQCGGRVTCGFTMAEAVQAYRALVASFGASWPERLAIARQIYPQKMRSERTEREPTHG